MTAIEFFDRTPIENVISSLTTVPDKIIFLGDAKQIKQFEKIYSYFISTRKIALDVVYEPIIRNNINSIVERLSEIVENENECVFDLTGGDDLVLVAMGIVFQKYKNTKKIQMQRFNVRSGSVTDCDNDGEIIYSGNPTLSVDEIIRLHGGAIRFNSSRDNKTVKWDLTSDFLSDIEKMWGICKTDPGLWNARISTIGIIDSFYVSADKLCVAFEVSSLKTRLKQMNVKYVSLNGLLRALSKNKLIFDCLITDELISFRYKNEQIKQCLTKAGLILELKVLVAANSLTNKDGTSYYNDSLNGVYIDWDGQFHEYSDDAKDTENEIDVVLVKGMIPIFISCKNGKIDDNELYKFDSVSNRFGGTYVKKALITTYVGKSVDDLKYFRQRAEDMKINLIENAHELSDLAFNKMVKHLVNGK